MEQRIFEKKRVRIETYISLDQGADVGQAMELVGRLLTHQYGGATIWSGRGFWHRNGHMFMDTYGDSSDSRREQMSEDTLCMSLCVTERFADRARGYMREVCEELAYQGLASNADHIHMEVFSTEAHHFNMVPESQQIGVA